MFIHKLYGHIYAWQRLFLSKEIFFTEMKKKQGTGGRKKGTKAEREGRRRSPSVCAFFAPLRPF